MARRKTETPVADPQPSITLEVVRAFVPTGCRDDFAIHVKEPDRCEGLYLSGDLWNSLGIYAQQTYDAVAAARSMRCEHNANQLPAYLADEILTCLLDAILDNATPLVQALVNHSEAPPLSAFPNYPSTMKALGINVTEGGKAS